MAAGKVPKPADDVPETQFERDTIRQAEELHQVAKHERIHRRCYGEVKFEIDMEEPCFDWNNKEYIRREDLEAEKYVVKRMRATVARSIDQSQYK